MGMKINFPHPLITSVGLLSIFFVFGALPCTAALGAHEEKLADANNYFAFNLLKQIAHDQAGTNIFISPYSVSAVLDMIENGAVGETKKEMDRVLGISGLGAESLNEACKGLDAAIRSAGTNVTLTLANSIWYRPSIQLRPEFSALNENYFHAALNMLDFTDPRAAGNINKWVEENTGGKIKKIIDPPIPGSFQVFLANAIYFKGTWLSQFDTRQTKQRLFHLGNAGTKPVSLMQQKGRFSYQESDQFQAIRLPYKGARLGMFVLLPQTNSTPEKILTDLDAAKWKNAMLPKFTSREGTIALPRFKVEYGVQLKPALQALGMKLPFSQNADFSKMSSTSLYLDEVKQKSYVEVNEEGTEAAAVTIGGMKATAVHAPTKPFEMIVDRPFILLIEDNLTKTLLFLGIIVDPPSG